MKCTPFRASLLLLAIFSVGFQLGGILAPAWHRVMVTIISQSAAIDTQLDVGFWMVITCVDERRLDGEICVTATMDEIQDTFEVNSNGGKIDLDELMIMKILTIVGVLLSICGLIMMCLYFWKVDVHPNNRTNGIIGSICWGIGASLVIAAVSIHGYQYMITKAGIQTLRKTDINMEVYLPWAIILSGCGAFLAVITGMTLAIRMCQRSRQTYAGYTNASLYKT